MPVFNFDFGKDSASSVSVECEQMFESLAENAWDGVVDALKDRKQEAQAAEVEPEREDEDVVR